MPLLPATAVTVSPTLQVARQRATQLYRDWLRAIPTIIELQRLDLTRKQFQDRVRREFEKNRAVRDHRVLDMLTLKGQMELHETINMWKNKTHVMRYFDDEGMTQWAPRRESFLDTFYASNAERVSH